jgi:hypothetical protein
MLHYTLLVATKGLTTNGVGEIIYHFSKLVQWVCANAVDTQELPIMEKESVIVLTLLEMHLLTSFVFKFIC